MNKSLVGDQVVGWGRCGPLLCNGWSHRLEEEQAEYGEEHKKFDKDNHPQLSSPRHLAEAFEVEHRYAAEYTHVLSVACDEKKLLPAGVMPGCSDRPVSARRGFLSLSPWA